MEENKGILKRIREALTRILNRRKALPSAEEEIKPTIKEEENNNFKKQYEVREQKDIVQEQEGEPFIEMLVRLTGKNIKDIDMEDAQEIINKLNDFYFSKDLEGYNFQIGTILDNDSPKNLYACSLSKYGETNEENKLPICAVGNKEEAAIVEQTLLDLKNMQDEEMKREKIKYILNNGFKLNDRNERFSVKEDFHLQQLLNKMLDEKSNRIKIETNYLFKETPKGIRVVESNRKIQRDAKIKEEEEKVQNLDYDNIIRNSVLKIEQLDLNSLSEKQIEALEEHYAKMLQEIDKSCEYLEMAIQCVARLSNNPKYNRILRDYYDIQEEYEKYKNNSLKRVDILRRQSNSTRVLLNCLSEELKKDLNKIRDTQAQEH